MKQLLILRGLPGSGKSTEALKWIAEDPKNRVRVNKDDLRRMMTGVDFDPRHESMIHDVFLQLVRLHLSKGKSVVADNTHLKQRYLNELRDLAASVGHVEVVIRCVNTSVEECLRRNNLRDRKVPQDVILNMNASKDKFHEHDIVIRCEKSIASSHDQSRADLPSAIIVDLDGTLALIGHRGPYDAAKAADDFPNAPVVELVKAMHARGHKIVFLSGREAKFEGPTREFIGKYVTEERYINGCGIETCVIPYELFMRSTDDRRKDSIVKRELYEREIQGRYNVLFTVDDRPSIVRLWRNQLGLTCLQVNDVEF